MQLESDPRGRIFVDPDAFVDMDDWHAVAADLRATAPVLLVDAEGYRPFWAITRHADVFEISRRSDVFLNTGESVLVLEEQNQQARDMGFDGPRSLVQMDGADHTGHRHITNDWFKPAAVKTRQPAIDDIAAQFGRRLSELGGRCDFAQDIAAPYSLHVIMDIFGVPESDEPMMLELTQGLFGANDPEYLGKYADPAVLGATTIMRFAMYFADITADRRACPANDLATVIANGQIDGCPIGDIERLWYYIIVATAGHDTTSFALSGGLQALLEHPDQQAGLRADSGLLAGAANEMIRWTSPVRHFLRTAQVDVDVHGTTIAAGERVMLSYPSANRDEDVFENAMSFDIRRPDADKLLSFGLGVHYCLGSQFARREVRTMLSELLGRTTAIEADGEAEWAAANFVGGVKHLPVRYDPVS